MQTLNEQAVMLGPRKSLVSVITKDKAAAATADRPTIVILNSGIVHRVGANRMTVRLARALAAAGHTVVRFDLSGVGDSEPRPEAIEPLDAALADIRDVLDSLEAGQNGRRFILGGLCSGANHTVVYAGTARRVVGTVLLEPSFPPGLKHYAHHFGRRIVRLDSWRRLARREHRLWRALGQRISRVAGRGSATGVNGDAGPVDEPRQAKITDPEIRAFLESAYTRLRDREIPLMVVLSGESWYYRESFLDAFPRVRFGDRLRLEFLEHADHVFTSQDARTRVIRFLEDWTKSTSFPHGDSGDGGDR